jgi:hypothetical protein
MQATVEYHLESKLCGGAWRFDAALPQQFGVVRAAGEVHR